MKEKNVSTCWSAEPFLSIKFADLFVVSKCLSEILETKTVSKYLSVTTVVMPVLGAKTWQIATRVKKPRPAARSWEMCAQQLHSKHEGVPVWRTKRTC